MKQNSWISRFRKMAPAWLATFVIGLAATVQATEVRVVRPVRGDAVRYVTLPGSIKANQQATLYAKVPGYLKSLTVDRGDAVQAGQVLGEIEVPELIADFAKHKAELRVAEVDLRRVREAATKAPDLVMPQTVDNAEGRVEIARANVERIETLLGYARLTAPFNGRVTARYLDPGAFVPSATSGSAAQTAAVLTLMDFNTVRVQVPVIEVEASHVARGQPVKVTVDGLPGSIFEGVISRLAFALDETTRTMLVEADLPNPKQELRPGMYATVRLGLERHADALLIPVAALVSERAGASTFVVADGKARKTPIKTGFNDGTNVEVLSGLTGAETVILLGKTTLADGAAVTVTEAK